MSETKQNQDSTDTEVKKDVTVFAYAEEGKYSDKRAFAHQIDEIRDYWGEITEETHEYYVYANGEEIFNGRNARRFCESVNVAVGEREELEGADGRQIVAKGEVNETTSYELRPDDCGKHILSEFEERVDEDNISGGLNSANYVNCRWRDESLKNKVSISSSGVKKRRVLTPKEERGPDNRFKGDGKVMSLKFDLTLGPSDEDMVQAWYKEVVLPFLKLLRQWGEIDNVEMADCKTQTVKEGDCFDF